MSEAREKMCEIASKLKYFRFSKDPTFDKKRHFLRKITIRYELYGNFGKDFRNENFQRGFLLYGAIGNFHVEET